MANERHDQSSDAENSSPATGEHSRTDESGRRHRHEDANAAGVRETMGNQGSEGSFGGQSSGSESGSADANGSTVAGGANAGAGLRGQSDQGGGMGGQPIGGNDSSTGTGTPLTQGYAGTTTGGAVAAGRLQGLGSSRLATNQHTTSNAGGSSVGSDQISGGSSGVSGGSGFVGSQADDSSEYLQSSERASDAAATSGSDFARHGRGAHDESEDESGGER